MSFLSSALRRPLWVVVLVFTVAFSSVVDAFSVANTILILARDEGSAYSAYSGLNGYGIPYEVVIVPSGGAALPTLANNGTETGNYGGIMIMGEVSYQYSDGFRSALSAQQWQDMFSYQEQYGVRMARINVFPTPEFGTTTANSNPGCCGGGEEQLLSFTDTSSFPTANLKTNAGVSTLGLWHYPAVITDASASVEIAKFGPGGQFTSDHTAAIINKNGDREQMVWFTSVAANWNMPTNYIQHAWIHWMTRGLYMGYRRILFNTQIDDMFLSTGLYEPAGSEYRVNVASMEAHARWVGPLNARLPSGSNYFIELAYNGNGDIIEATSTDRRGVCNPDEAIFYPEQVDPPLEFQKPLGTGADIWPETPDNYTWSEQCAEIDPLMKWTQSILSSNDFSHMSHTFSHMNLNNATYDDAFKEIQFNQDWMAQTGIAGAPRYSGNGLVPPAITGLNNGDVLRAWSDLGLTSVVGDNTRTPLRNQQSEYWPLFTTVADDGFAGFQITPRWATTIFFNCDLPQCTTNEWIQTSGGSGDFDNLLEDAKRVNLRHMFSLHHDPFMFHQANLRQDDAPSTTVNGETQQLSMFQIWVEVILTELSRLTDWPVITLKHDDMSKTFADRMTRDMCNPKMTYDYSSDGNSITGVTVSTDGNSCGAPIPVTFPGAASTGGFRTEQIGSDPLTVWAEMSGSPVSFSLSQPITV